MHHALESLQFLEATPVQAEVIPIALEGKDVLVSAETGSGKTAAFLLPILQRMLVSTNPASGTRALILVPTRELARQINKQCRDFVRYTPIKVGVITGGDEFKYQKALFRKNPEILIATPGRLHEHMDRGHADFTQLEVLVLDEADRMLDMGFSEEVLDIVSRCNKQRQSMLFSATLSEKLLGGVAGEVLNDPTTITLNSVQDQHENIRQEIVLSDSLEHKESQLGWLIKNETFVRALVFTNTRNRADKLGGMLRGGERRVGILHGDMDQTQRNYVLQQMRNSRIDILIATDLAARGLDVKNIDLVVNFDMARSGDDYIHRIGRTGRAGAKGLTISLISAYEWNRMINIERYLRHTFERRDTAELKGKFKGPEKLKNSGKTVGTKKDKKKEDKVAKDEPKQRHRDKKNVGKRRTPTDPTLRDAAREVEREAKAKEKLRVQRAEQAEFDEWDDDDIVEGATERSAERLGENTTEKTETKPAKKSVWGDRSDKPKRDGYAAFKKKPRKD
ncbi:MAG: DEAD/DEAH box helicase [Pseudomonadales bacterium]|nr:DEAD/DEAH box helicase [Pseudomonadales bacterium]